MMWLFFLRAIKPIPGGQKWEKLLWVFVKPKKSDLYLNRGVMRVAANIKI